MHKYLRILDGLLQWTRRFEALTSNGTWECVPLSARKKAITSKWVYKVKLKVDDSIERFKARLVAKDFTQLQGIDYYETFNPVVKMSTIRCIFSVATSHHWSVSQLDINNVFLHLDLLEEVYMKPSQGMDILKDCVCKLKKSLYGLKHARGQWFSMLNSALLLLGYSQSKNVQICLPLLHSNITSNPEYTKLVPANSPPLSNPEYYRSMVGKLNFLTITRPDLDFSIQTLSQFLQQPDQSHLAALEHVLDYVSNIVRQGLLLRLMYVPTGDQLADILTKALPSPQHTYLMSNQLDGGIKPYEKLNNL
ncbi:transmembrane signal receptor [Lithospermum erythrorhizon]|uniref:Transmembrane signal receptor n=1 Tax=Lithospermum erythrorhizon TaxID=34254 RepID=A0AAV3S2Z6_LITER